MVNSQYCFAKLSGMGPLVSRIDWCEGHWFGSTYMAVRLSDIRPITGKKWIFCVFSHFWAYVGQPHDHIGWTKSMPFASINPTNPRTHPAQFGKKILRIDHLAKWGFFESAILDFCFRFFFLFCLIPWKIVKGSWIARMGRNFDDYPGFQPFRSWANTYAQDCKFPFSLSSLAQWVSNCSTVLVRILMNKSLPFFQILKS